LVLFRKCDLRPPEAGPYTDMAALNAKLSGLTISGRMETKTHLANAGLLPLR